MKAILLYDATCRFCRAGVKRTMWVVPRGSVELRDVNDPVLQAKYGVTPEGAKRAMHLISLSGRMTVGAYAMRDLLRMSRWAWPLAYLWVIPGFPWIASRLYSWIADHRYLFMGKDPPGEDSCEDGVCQLYLGKRP